jgi:hypothetical protein
VAAAAWRIGEFNPCRHECVGPIRHWQSWPSLQDHGCRRAGCGTTTRRPENKKSGKSNPVKIFSRERGLKKNRGPGPCRCQYCFCPCRLCHRQDQLVCAGVPHPRPGHARTATPRGGKNAPPSSPPLFRGWRKKGTSIPPEEGTPIAPEEGASRNVARGRSGNIEGSPPGTSPRTASYVSEKGSTSTPRYPGREGGARGLTRTRTLRPSLLSRKFGRETPRGTPHPAAAATRALMRIAQVPGGGRR